MKFLLIRTFIFILLIETYPIWARIFGGWWNLLFYLVIFILFISLLVRLIKELFRLIKQRKSLSIQKFYPIFAILFTCIYVRFSPILNLEDNLFGKTILKAYYSGTQTQATFTLRDNGDFVVHHTGVFFYDQYRKGKYTYKNDTLILSNSKELHYTLSDTMLIKDGYFWTMYGLEKTRIKVYE